MAQKRALARGSSSRATCMVSVEPPETMRPLRDELAGRAHERERIDAAMGAEALVLIGEQQLEEARIDIVDASPAAASGPPAWR